MTQGLITLYVSDIVRLLGALGLLSLGIALALWGLKRHRSGAIVITLGLCLAALVPTVLAVELPPAGSVAQIQTSGPNTPLNVGDWYTSRNPDAGGPGYHAFNIYIPCTISHTQMITVELFDPGLWHDGSADEVDEIRDNTPAHNYTTDNAYADDATFVLSGPSGVPIHSYTYGPSLDTSGVYTTFASFSVGTYGCGAYRLTVTTSDDDDNAWRLRVTPDDPDGTPGTGDEISVGNLQTSYQHELGTFGCQTFHFFVPDTLSVRLNNFDMDVGAGNLCEPGICTVVYTTPSGTVIDGNESGSTDWNNGSGASPPPYPPPGGDPITNPEPGWWQAQLCLNDDNQYIFDPGGQVYFFDRPPVPDMSVGKDDGTATFYPDGALTYTITYANTGTGAAVDAVLTDTLPLSTTFVSCTPRPGESCGEVPPPGSGIVTFSLGTIIAGDSGFVMVSVRVDPSVPPGTMTNTVELDYTDIIFSDYPPETDIDVDQYGENPAIEIAKTVYLGHDSGAGCPGSEIVTDTNGADVTYCFEVINTGGTHLGNITINDTDLGITDADMTLQVSMSDPYPPLAPGGSLVYYYEGTINGYLVNTAQTEGNPTDANGGDLSGLDNPTAADGATVDISLVDPTITKSGDPAVASPGEMVTFIMQVTNSGIADAHDVVVTDVIPDYLTIIGIPTTTKGTVQQPIVNNTVVVDIGTIAGNDSEVVVITIVTEVKAGTAPGTVVENQASLAFAEGGDRQSNIVYVEVPGEAPAPEPPESEPSEPDDSEPGPPPPAPPSAAAAAPTPTPTVEVLAVARLPETGGFPGWLTVLLGVPIIIGAAGLLNLALLETRGRRGDGKGD